MNATKNKLAMAILAISLTQAVNASENTFEPETENKSTYWGLGIGSVLGAVIAGPPGAAIGATLGGSIGWGKAQSDALDEGQHEFVQQELALQERSQLLERKLNQTEQEMQVLKQSHAMQTTRLKEVQSSQDPAVLETEFLARLVALYTQDIYFRIGQADAPDDAPARLSGLVELLKTYPEIQVSLKGYTDPTGSAKLNAELAQARVDSVKQVLLSHGIDASRITSRAMGEVSVAEPDLSAKQTDHRLDRRVAIQLNMMKPEVDQPLASLSVGEP